MVRVPGKVRVNFRDTYPHYVGPPTVFSYRAYLYCRAGAEQYFLRNKNDIRTIFLGSPVLRGFFLPSKIPASVVAHFAGSQGGRHACTVFVFQELFVFSPKNCF